MVILVILILNGFWKNLHWKWGNNLKVIVEFFICWFQKYATLQEQYYTLKDHCLEQERTLEELGMKLRDSNLQISEIKEEIVRNKPDGAWVKDNLASNCKACAKEFNLTRRRVSLL